MSAGIVSTYDVKAGRTAEAVTFLLEAADYMSGLADGTAQVRNSWLAGEAAGLLQLITQYPTVAAQMAGFDAIMADIANNPLGRLGAEKGMPLRVRSRYTFSTLDAAAEVAPPFPVMTTLNYQIAAGKRAAGLDAFTAAEALHGGMGVTARALQIGNAGPLSGSIVYAVGANNYTTLGTFGANLAQQPTHPLADATAAGTLLAAGGQSSAHVSGG